MPDADDMLLVANMSLAVTERKLRKSLSSSFWLGVESCDVFIKRYPDAAPSFGNNGQRMEAALDYAEKELGLKC